ncbi:MAG: tryptophan 2,3-dioxygenase, partial [Fulvivirga sp.]|nr:tryptophan 2,3-dioxygenase [Fulvivirga sp.]
DLYNLVAKDERSKMERTEDLSNMLDSLYWKKGATELASGKKTLTLKQFEEKYYDLFLQRAEDFKTKNLLKIYQDNFKEIKENKALIDKLRKYDVLVNISWPLAHYKSAVRYLQKKPEDIAATGGTNWQKFLPPQFQKIIFFPELWSEQEQKEWGKTWVIREVFGEQP